MQNVFLLVELSIRRHATQTTETNVAPNRFDDRKDILSQIPEKSSV